MLLAQGFSFLGVKHVGTAECGHYVKEAIAFAPLQVFIDTYETSLGQFRWSFLSQHDRLAHESVVFSF